MSLIFGLIFASLIGALAVSFVVDLLFDDEDRKEAKVREMYAEGERRAAETAHAWPGTPEYEALHQILDEDGVYHLTTLDQVVRYQERLKSLNEKTE